MYNLFGIFFLQEFSSPLLIAGIFIPIIMLQTTVIYEDMNKSEIIINCLPVKKEKIIMARYLTVFLYQVISILAYVVISFLIKISNLSFPVETVTVSEIIICVALLGILASIYLTVYYKFGYIKSRLYYFIFVFAALVLPALILDIFHKTPGAGFSGSVQGLFSGTHNFVLVMLTCLIVAVSFYISVYLYKKREF